MKTTTKLIGILSALIVVILAIFLVTKFNSHDSARVSSSSSPARTVKKSSSSSSKAVKNDKKAAQSSAAVSSKENDNQDSAVAPKASSQKQAQAGITDGGQVAEATARTDKAKTEKGTDNSQSSLNFGSLDNGDISSIVGTWTNASGESVTINADGTIIKNSTGYTAQLKPQGVSDNTFNASVVSQDDSVALSVVAGGVGSSDYLVIGANGPYYRN